MTDTPRTRDPLVSEFELPDPGSERMLQVGDYIIFIKVDYDSDAQNPLEECDTMGTIRSFSNRHVNHIRSKAELDEIIQAHRGKRKESDAVLLSYFEHGECVWGVAGTMSGMPDFRWDGTEYAGVWFPDKALIDDAAKLTGKARREKMVMWAEQACSVYTEYCNGWVYCYDVAAYRVRYHADGFQYDDYDDYRFDKPVFGDSCCGIYNGERKFGEESYLESQVKDAIEGALDTIAKGS